MGEKNRHFSREFKRDAVQLVTEKGMPVGKVARELDIHPNLLHLWRRRFLAKGDKAFVGKGRVTPEGAEIKGLRKKLEKVRQERDILKKALAAKQKMGSVQEFMKFLLTDSLIPRERELHFYSVRTNPALIGLR